MNLERAQRVIQFIECLIVPSGEGQGEPFCLDKFQKDFIRDVYAPEKSVGKGKPKRRQVRRAILSIARKNGKTALIAALVLAHLVGPEAIPNGEIYSAANDREQAAQVYKVAAQMVRADPELASMLRCVDSTKTIVCYANGSVYRAISAEAGTKHGLNPSLVIYDELAQSKNRELYDVLDTAMGAREEPLFITISTQSNDPLHILSQLIDDGMSGKDPTTVCHLYAVPDDVADIFDEKVWALANPALGKFRNIDDLRAMAERARRMPSFEAPFRNLYLNQRTSPETPLIARSEWEACKVPNMKIVRGERVYLALDLSATTDLCSMVAVTADPGDDRCQGWFWKPSELLEEHERRDRAPYALWAKQGHIDAVSGRVIKLDHVAARIGWALSEFEVVGLAYDRWRMEVLIQELERQGIDYYRENKDDARAGALRLVDWGQGFKDMAPAIDALEASILERSFAHDGNPVLTMCFANALAISDPAGNRKLDKSKSRFRIDGAVATAMAIGLKARDGGVEVAQPSPWDTDSDYKVMVV